MLRPEFMRIPPEKKFDASALAESQRVKCVINCNAHRFEHAGFLRLGAGIARKGWLTKEDVINTLPLERLQEELQRKRRR